MARDLVPYSTEPVPACHAVLALAPHPDDEVFGCGGALALHREAGAQVRVVIATRGEAAGGDAEDRIAESARAAAELGYAAPVCWDLPDQGVLYGEALVRRIIDEAERHEATVIYAPSLWEVHADHRAIALAAIEAVRRMGPDHVLMAYEVGATLRPNVLIDISGVLARKRAAMACFPSQMARQCYDRHIEALNVFRTYTLPGHVDAAEAFERHDGKALAAGDQAFLKSEYQRQFEAGLMRLPEHCPKVSIIVLADSADVGVGETLASIAVQTWPNIEVLLPRHVADALGCDPDWCGRFPVSLFDGLDASDAAADASLARIANAGLSIASGELLMFIDEHSRPRPDHVAMLVDKLERAPEAVLAYGAGTFVDVADGTRVDLRDEVPPQEELLAGNFIATHGALIRGQPDCRLDETLGDAALWDLWIRMAALGRFVHAPDLGHGPAKDVEAAAGEASGDAVRRLVAKRLDQAGPSAVESLAQGVRRAWRLQLELRACREDFAARSKTSELQHVEAMNSLREQHRIDVARVTGERDETVARLTSERDEVSLRLAACESALQSMKDSRSWKITAPLRRLTLFIGRMTRKAR